MNDPSLRPPLNVDTSSNTTTRVKAAIVILVRNSELNDLRFTMHQLEDRWNKKFHYPYVFLNDVEFTDEFKELTTGITESETSYGLVPTEMWSYPSWINQTKADENRERMEKDNIIYGGSLPYRHMCRFNSGFFFRHPLLDEYDWYWRVEPSVEFSCNLDYDPFLFMQKNNLTYGFTISLFEFNNTIPTLWQTVKSFMRENKELVNPKNVMNFITDGTEDYNLCHFWSNFEIGNLNFWRSERYIKFFEYLDQQGGFFYERWGDAPVHSIALAMFLEKSEIHFFNDIAYRHNPYQHCPEDKDRYHYSGLCHCDPNENFDEDITKAENHNNPGESSTQSKKPRPNIILGKDGKPCRACTAFKDWTRQERKKDSSESTTTSSTSLSSSTTSIPFLGAAKKLPKDCPADSETLGRHTWTFLHTMAAYYSDTPTTTQQTMMLSFLRTFSYVYPCWYCAEHLRDEMLRKPPRVENRNVLSRWMCEMHNGVNQRLGKKIFDCSKVDERWRDGPKDGRCD
ncbi:11075_t:CDS:2 [Ambispora gerdemannii]|uniref:Sulfhydryl oxidase n=1 Tax=Ambispora gerdemannii TaxID=144530 RepID=A0A9N8UZ54_9GLOM|nr:11075_t:CDS:2 [Ambispora gerdemannii]